MIWPQLHFPVLCTHTLLSTANVIILYQMLGKREDFALQTHNVYYTARFEKLLFFSFFFLGRREYNCTEFINCHREREKRWWFVLYIYCCSSLSEIVSQKKRNITQSVSATSFCIRCKCWEREDFVLLTHNALHRKVWEASLSYCNLFPWKPLIAW